MKYTIPLFIIILSSTNLVPCDPDEEPPKLSNNEQIIIKNQLVQATVKQDISGLAEVLQKLSEVMAEERYTQEQRLWAYQLFELFADIQCALEKERHKTLACKM